MAFPIIRITEKKRIRLRNDCFDNPVYLSWFTKLGIDYWLFGRTQTETLRVSADQIFERDIIDLENADTIKDFLSKEAVLVSRLGAENLDDNDIDGLRGLLTSPKVQVLVSQNPIKWQTVLLSPGSFRVKDTRERRHKLEIDIVHPDQIIQTQ